MLSSAIVFAVLSLVFGGLNDVVFKRYNSVERSRGVLIFGIGLVWSALLVLDISLRGKTIEFTQSTWSYGLTAGVCVAVANIMLLESLRHMEVSLGSTIYRLNTIAVVILSVVFLAEPLSAVKLAGIFSGVVAVLLLHRHHNISGPRATLKIGLGLVIIAAVLRAVYGVITKAGLSAGADADGLILVTAVCWVFSGGIYALFFEHRYGFTKQNVVFTLVSGVLVYAIVRTLVTALSLGEASVVITIANMSFLMALVVAILLKMEVMSPRKFAAMFFATSAIVILTQA